tara:strand:- start:552 stop:920 length:369 start_codon:yes stop_codon:yes gene_type:complete
MLAEPKHISYAKKLMNTTNRFLEGFEERKLIREFGANFGHDQLPRFYSKEDALERERNLYEILNKVKLYNETTHREKIPIHLWQEMAGNYSLAIDNQFFGRENGPILRLYIYDLLADKTRKN